MADNKNDRISTSLIKATVEKEIWTMENHIHWRCCSVTMAQRTPTRLESLAEMRWNTS
jgi:hypothetical protein